VVAAIAPRPDSSSSPTPRPRLYVIPGGPTPRPSRRLAPAVYRRRRVVALVVLAGVVAGVLVGLGLVVRTVVDGPAIGPAAIGTPPSRPAASRVWVVRPGDTLWSIALASGDKGDVRPLVDRLWAEVHGQPLLAGERIALP
jgi:hypothetical protein